MLSIDLIWDAWADHYKQRNGRPAQRRSVWDTNERQALPNEAKSGISTKKSVESEFAKALETDRLQEAEKYLAKRLETIRQATVYGIRPKRIFRQAATKFLLENQHKKSIHTDKDNLVILDSEPSKLNTSI